MPALARGGITLRGFDEVRQSLGEITTRMADAAARKAVRAGAKPIIAQARANLAALPLADSTGLLRRSIGVRTRKYRTRVNRAGVFKADTRILAAAGVHVAIIGSRRAVAAVVQRRVPGGSRPVFSRPANYAHLIEKGVRPHRIGQGSRLARGRRSAGPQTGGQHPGFAAKPWLAPAFFARKAEAEAIMAQTFREALQLEVARARAKVANARGRAA